MKLLYIDLFCGAGGVTTGVSQVPGAHVVACVNHDATAIASHAANHPTTLHYTEDIRTFDTAPMAQRLEEMRVLYPNAKTVLWASCECTNFSRAKGGQSRDADSRTLAEHLYRYVEDLNPDFIQVENVTEFLDWGPLIKKRSKKTGLPVLKWNKKKGQRDFVWITDPQQKGVYFNHWRRWLFRMGYSFDYRIYNAADFGAYTTRKRLFIQLARHGEKLSWPRPKRNRKTWKPCSDVLDLDDFGKSIFERKIPLCDATLRRLTEGVRKFAKPQFVFRYMSGPGHVHDADNPAPTVCTQKNIYLATSKFMTRYFSGEGHNTSINTPCGTITTIPHQYPVTIKFIDNYFGQGYPTSVKSPMGTLCTKQQRYIATAIFLANYYSGGGQLTEIRKPCPTLTTNPKSHVVTASYIRAMMRPNTKGLVYSINDPIKTLLTRDYFYLDSCIYNSPTSYSRPAKGDTEAMLFLKKIMREKGISDICMRPISIKESLRIMGFPEDYKLKGTQTQQRKFIGNAVEVNMARCIAEATAKTIEYNKKQIKQQLELSF